MKRWQFIVSLVLSAICLALSVSAIILQRSTRDYQQRLQTAQAEINRAREGNQLARVIVQDLVGAAPANDNIRVFLKRHGVEVSPQPETPAATAKPSGSTGKRTTKSGRGK